MIAALIAISVVGLIYVGARSAESLGGRPRRATDRTGDGGESGNWPDGGSAGDGGCGGNSGGGCD